jgi:hypothetical protein
MKICSLAALKIFLEETGTTFDILLGQILDDVSARMMAALNRELRAGTYTEYHRTPSRTIYLRARPVTAITSVDYQDNPIDSEFYDSDLDLGAIYFDDWVTDQETARGMKIVYTGGYAEDVNGVLTGAATDLHLIRLAGAVKKQAAKEFLHRKDIGVSSFTMPDGSTSNLEALPWLPEVLDVISLEKRWTIG